MAASMAASQLSHFSYHVRHQSSLSDVSLLTPFKPYDFHLKCYRNLSIRALHQGENKLNKETQALNLPSANDFPSNIVFKDVLALPRPLYSAQFSGSISDGSRLRVAYAIILEKYGVSGAYSKSAAQRAYANCEAVPCDEFDTAFEIHSGIPLEKDRIGIFIQGIALRANPYRLLCSQRP